MDIRTDLALEAHELCREAGETTQLQGVRARETRRRGVTTTVVEVLDDRGARALGKPVGTYVTLEFSRAQLRKPRDFAAAAAALGRALAALLPGQGPVLVAGLGNMAVTPDALGPKALEHLVVTRHLGRGLPQLRPVSAIAPGVLGTTGLESAEVLRAVIERAAPKCVVAVDALAARRVERICTTVQLTDTGITPGAGVGNRRAGLSRETLGVPVIAVGAPTVADAGTLLRDTLTAYGVNGVCAKSLCASGLVVSPRDIDAQVALMARFLGWGLSLGLHRRLTPEDVAGLVG